MKNQLILIYILFLTTISACNSSSNYNQRNSMNLEFKSWIKDTVPIIESHHLAEYKITIGTDSLSLELKKYYNFDMKMLDSVKTESEVQKVLCLLKKYKEYPTDSFRISFNTMDYFHPSQVDQLRFEEIFEIQNLMVISTQDTSIYQYIRGRLSGKKVKAKNGRYEEYDFIWDNNELKKTLLK